MASLWIPSFVLPTATGTVIFYAVAALEHVRANNRNRNETVAVISDFFVAAILLGFAAAFVLAEN